MSAQNTIMNLRQIQTAPPQKKDKETNKNNTFWRFLVVVTFQNTIVMLLQYVSRVDFKLLHVFDQICHFYHKLRLQEK